MKSKAMRVLTRILVIFFALIGFGLTFAFFGVKMHWFNDPGGVDYNDRYFQKIDADYSLMKADTGKNEVARIARFYARLNVVNQYFPKNAQLIQMSYSRHGNILLAERMLAAIDMNMLDSADYNRKVREALDDFPQYRPQNPDSVNVFEWMNISEWSDFKVAVLKDTALIDSAAKVTDIEPRLIVSVLLGEQMRLFNSTREMYKNVIKPLKILSVEAKFSLGVTGIKEETAMKAEKYLKDSTSVYYPGKKYQNLLDFYTEDPVKERYDRLVDYRNHYYSYLYAAVILKQMKLQWKRAGFDISDRPEILATLFNVGYDFSVPKANPSVGGSNIQIKEKNYTFGALAFEFYYSGEMADIFPYKPELW
jgi:hypothetical protein